MAHDYTCVFFPIRTACENAQRMWYTVRLKCENLSKNQKQEPRMGTQEADARIVVLTTLSDIYLPKRIDFRCFRKGTLRFCG